MPRSGTSRGARAWRALKVDTVAGRGVRPRLGRRFSPDGRTLAVGGADRLVHLWDVGTGKLVRELEQNVGTRRASLEFSPDGSVLAISGFEPVRGALGRRDGHAGSARALAAPAAATTMIDLSPDGRRLLVTHGDGRGAVWDIDPTVVGAARLRAGEPHA